MGIATEPPAGQAIRQWTSCPVCASPGRSDWVRFELLAFVRCDGCGAVYKSFEREDLRPPEFYEKAYFHGRKSGRDRRFEHRVRKAMRWLKAVLSFGAARSLLDVGCSFGYVIEAGKRLGLASAGTDYSQYAVQVCRERGYRAEQGSVDALPFADAEFDLVVLKHVVEHTPDPKKAMSELRRVLTPRGLALIAVPDLAYWKGQRQRRTYRYFRPDDLGQQHYVYYDDGAMRRLLETNGFEILADSKAVGSALVKPLLAAWVAIAKATRMRRELFFIVRRK